MELDIDYLRDYNRSIEILELDAIDKNKIPDSWNDIFSESDMKNRIKKVLDIWRKYVANEFKNTIAYLERNLESVDLVEYEGKVSIIYGIKMSDGEIDYYEGGNPKELFNNDVLENSWSKVPESVKVFYEKVHNGFYYYPSKAMGLVPSEFVTYFDDDEWGIIEELEEPLKIDLKSTFGFFKNGMGGYVAIDLDNCNNNKGVLWFADSKPRYDIDFWSVVDEWTVIGFE